MACDQPGNPNRKTWFEMSLRSMVCANYGLAWYRDLANHIYSCCPTPTLHHRNGNTEQMVNGSWWVTLNQDLLLGGSNHVRARQYWVTDSAQSQLHAVQTSQKNQIAKQNKWKQLQTQIQTHTQSAFSWNSFGVHLSDSFAKLGTGSWRAHVIPFEDAESLNYFFCYSRQSGFYFKSEILFKNLVKR